MRSRATTASPTVDLSAVVGSLTLSNPVMTAAGTAGHGTELAAYFPLSELGAHVVKSVSPEPWPGNAPPRLVPVPGGMLNSVGLQGPGVEAWMEEELPRLEASGARVVVSIWGRRVADYGRAAGLLKAAPPCVVAVEVNVSCPNVEDREKIFAHSAPATEEALAATAVCGRPRWAKLSPNVTDLAEIAAAALRGGAEALTLVNTLMALRIDTETYRFALGAGGGGLSGPALHPVALRAVHECHKALPGAALIGAGGVSSGREALEFLLAGASAVQVGTATLADPRAPVRVLAELTELLERAGVKRLDEVIGAAHG